MFRGPIECRLRHDVPSNSDLKQHLNLRVAVGRSIKQHSGGYRSIEIYFDLLPHTCHA